MIDLYRLLELQPLEADRDRIQAALVRCRNAAEKAGDETTRKRATRLYELGRSHLLNQKKKAEYDLKWQAEFGLQPTHVGLSSRGSEDMDALQPYLPVGDPRQSFDLASYLKDSANFSPTPIEADFDELISFLQTPGSEVLGGVPQAEYAMVAKPMRNSIEPSSFGSGENPSRSPQKPLRSATSLATSLRKKRDHSLLMIVGGLLLSVAVVLAVILVVTRSGDESSEVAVQPDRDTATEQAQMQRVTAQGNASKRPAGSGLPQLTIPLEASETASEDAIVAAVSNDPPGFDASETMQPAAKPSTANANTPNTLDPQPPANNDPTLTPKEQQAWQAALQAVHQNLVAWQWKEARLQVSELNSVAQTLSQRQQLRCMQSALELAEQAHEALLEAIQGLAAGAMLKVRSNQLAFVEGDEQQVVFRIEGRNQRFPLRELPIGILESLLDLKLDSINELAQAQKASFVLIHPKASELVIPRVRKALERAEQNQRIPVGTLSILEGH